MPAVTRLLPLNGVSEPKIVGKRARYPRQLAEYAGCYSVHVWSLKQWIKIGKRSEAGLPPLDFPEQMASWYERTHKHRAPENLLALASAPALAPMTQNQQAGKIPTTSLADAPQSPAERLNWLRRMAPGLQQQMTRALSRGENFVAESIRRMLSPIHDELLKLESQLATTKQDGEQLSPGERRRRAALVAELKENIKSNREYFLAGIVRKLVLAFGNIDYLTLLSDSGKASIDGPGFRCMRGELEYARAAARVLTGFIESIEHRFGILLEAVERAQPEQWENCGALFAAIPPHLVEPLYDFALASHHQDELTQTIETQTNGK